MYSSLIQTSRTFHMEITYLIYGIRRQSVYGLIADLQFTTMKTVAILLSVVSLTGCIKDDNVEAVYGKDTGLPVNCRAYIQTAVDEYRARKYSAEGTLDGIERNCGSNGMIWKDNRDR